MSMCKNMLSKNGNNFISSFLISVLFICFACLIVRTGVISDFS